MQQETLWARVKGLRRGGSTMDTQMCSSLNPDDVRVWKILLRGRWVVVSMKVVSNFSILIKCNCKKWLPLC